MGALDSQILMIQSVIDSQKSVVVAAEADYESALMAGTSDQILAKLQIVDDAVNKRNQLERIIEKMNDNNS